jgi:uncharacterized integral membrane protein
MTQPAEETRPSPDVPVTPDAPAGPDASDASDAPSGRSAQLPQHVVTPTRIGAIWASAVGFAVVLLLLLIFILQNGQRVDVSFYGAHAHSPLGVALLLAAVFGVLLVVVPGIGRMMQLRFTARRHRRADASPEPPETDPEE